MCVFVRARLFDIYHHRCPLLMPLRWMGAIAYSAHCTVCDTPLTNSPAKLLPNKQNLLVAVADDDDGYSSHRRKMSEKNFLRQMQQHERSEKVLRASAGMLCRMRAIESNELDFREKLKSQEMDNVFICHVHKQYT